MAWNSTSFGSPPEIAMCQSEMSLYRDVTGRRTYIEFPAIQHASTDVYADACTNVVGTRLLLITYLL